MLSSSRDALLKLFKSITPPKLFQFDCGVGGARVQLHPQPRRHQRGEVLREHMKNKWILSGTFRKGYLTYVQ